MDKIQVLDSSTIDKIAAGEVVERPLNVVKELVENAIDAKSKAVTVEIKEGGIEFIRVTDNGCGINNDQVSQAFLRHATSKITKTEDLTRLVSLGFRGEALSSIAAVSKVEMITKTSDELAGTRFLIDGGIARSIEEIGAPNGTTVVVRNLFYNTPARRKFLKQPITEAGYISDLIEHLALSRPNISFQFIQNGKVRFFTTGNCDLKEVIYRIYGREISENLIEVNSEDERMKVYGYLGKPILNRSNRNFEMYFVNGRYSKNQVITKAIEDGYKEYLMQHKFPFLVLHIELNSDEVDVNVHPTKMEIRFSDSTYIYDYISSCISSTLKVREMIPNGIIQNDKQKNFSTEQSKIPEPFEIQRTKSYFEKPDINTSTVAENVHYQNDNSTCKTKTINIGKVLGEELSTNEIERKTPSQGIIKASNTVVVEKPMQMELFEDRFLSKEARNDYEILGQVFDTYWIVAFKEKLFFIDQHAAHEKVKYEQFISQYRNREIVSQNINPPIIFSANGKEYSAIKEYFSYFQALGFELEEFGGNEYAIRSVPSNLYGCDEKQLFSSILDEIVESSGNMLKGNPDVVTEKIASMACKAAVKGNNSLSRMEIEVLIDELLKLENPYNCPHGRPTIFSLSRYEIEKYFKRIVT